MNLKSVSSTNPSHEAALQLQETGTTARGVLSGWQLDVTIFIFSLTRFITQSEQTTANTFRLQAASLRERLADQLETTSLRMF